VLIRLPQTAASAQRRALVMAFPTLCDVVPVPGGCAAPAFHVAHRGRYLLQTYVITASATWWSC
jgi:hypothetical protein